MTESRGWGVEQRLVMYSEQKTPENAGSLSLPPLETFSITVAGLWSEQLGYRLLGAVKTSMWKDRLSCLQV